MTIPIRRATRLDEAFLWSMLAEAANWRGEQRMTVVELQMDDHDCRYVEEVGSPGTELEFAL